MFLAVRDLWWARGRFALMVGAIALISLLVVMLTGLTQGLGRQSTSAITSLRADRIAVEVPADGAKVAMSTSRLTDGQVQRARSTVGVRSADPIGIMSSRVVIHGSGAPAALFGVAPGVPAAPPALTGDGAVVSTDLAADHSLHTGDAVSVAGRSLTVKAIVDDASYSHQPVVWVPMDVWRELAGGRTAGAGTILALRTGSDFDRSAFDSALGTQTASPAGSLSAVGSYSEENGSLTMIRGLLVAISALVIGAFFTVWTVQREGDLAVLKAIGARTSYLVRDALGQALLTLVIGGGLGTGGALLLGLFLQGRMPLVIDTRTVIIPFLLMVVVGLVGAIAALRRVVTVDPMTALASAR